MFNFLNEPLILSLYKDFDYEEVLKNYSEDEIVAFCSDDYTEGEVLMWLAEGINYDLICDCINKHEIWD